MDNMELRSFNAIEEKEDTTSDKNNPFFINEPLRTTAESSILSAPFARRIPSFLLMQVDGDINMVRFHFETSNDSVILLKTTLLITCLLVLVWFLYVVITQDVIQKLKQPSSFLFFLNIRTVVSFVTIMWFIAFCLLSHLVHLNFDLPPEGELLFADIRKDTPKCNVCVLPSGDIGLLHLDKEKSILMEGQHSVIDGDDKEVNLWSTRTRSVRHGRLEEIELREVASVRA